MSLFSVIALKLLFITQANIINITDNTYQNITCPSSESCQVICFAEHSCSNIDIHCQDNDYGCSIYCNPHSCQNSRIYFINAIKSEVTCSSTNSASYSESCRHSEIYIVPKNNNSTVFIDIQSRIGSIDKIQINYNGNTPFINNEISYYSNITTFDTTQSIPIYPITILCRNYNSCRDLYIKMTSLNYFKLHCLSINSCYNLEIDFISYNNDHRGTLNMFCNGERACYNTDIHAITAHKFEMICSASIDSCSSVLIECPIAPIETWSENSCILSCLDDSSCSDAVIYAMYGMIQLNPMYVDNVVMYCGYDFNVYCIVGDDCNRLCAPIQASDSVQLMLPFYDNTVLQCDKNIFTEICIILMSSDIIESVSCGNSSICIVLCTGMNCGGHNTMIDGYTADILRLQSLNDYYFNSIDIYGPMNGEFISNAELNTAVLYVSTSNKVEMLCSSSQTCTDVLIFANDTNMIKVNCDNPSSCQYISIFVSNMQYETTSNISPIPYCQLYWNCNDGCVNNTNTIFINNNIQCDVHTYDNQWFCNEYILSTSCNITNTSTQLMDNDEERKDKASFWNKSGGLLGLGILMLCCSICIIGLFITKKSVKKKISLAKHQDPPQPGHSRHDTVGSTVEDIIKESSAFPFTNPLGIQIADNILNNGTDTPVIKASAAPPPPPSLSIPPKPPLQDGVVQLQYANNYYKQRGSSRKSSHYVYGHPQSVYRDHTMEGSMDLESRINRYSSDIDMNHTISRSGDSRHSSLGIAQDISNKQRTFSSPSLVVLSIEENASNTQHLEADGADNASSSSSTEDSDGMYDSMSNRAEGGKDTTTIK